MNEPTLLGKDITIGRNVTFGQNVIIYDGVEIGDDVTVEHNAIIGYDRITHLRHDFEFPPKPWTTRLGNNVLVRPNAIIYKHCKIGDFSQICSGVVMREFTELGNHSYLGNGTCVEGYTRIGNYTGVHTQVHVTAKVIIEDKVFIAPLTVISNGFTINWQRPHVHSEEMGAKIRRGARIAIGVKTLPGVEIGREALIGAGALVTKDVPPFKIAIGVPARIVGDVPESERLRD